MKTLHIGDLHFGEKGNSAKFNEQILEFLGWVVDLAIDNEVDYIIQHGDYFHTRHKIDVESMNYGIKGAEILSEFGAEKVIVLQGNHDLYYLERLDVSSVASIKNIVRVVDTPEVIKSDIGDSMLIIPWVTTGEMWDFVVDASANHDYLCAHLELNGFKVNDGYEMEHGFSPVGLRKYKRVITGHYHSMQTKGNITYLGTPYPITMSEANEPHGIFILDTDTDEFTFHEYEKVKVLSMSLEEYLDVRDTLDPENTSIRIEFPDDLDDETVIDEVKNDLASVGFSDYKIKYTSKKVNEILNSDTKVEEVENIDQAVVHSIRDLSDVPGVEKERLEKFYNMAIEKGSES